MVRRIEWSFPDPLKFPGTDVEILLLVRKVRDEIKEKVFDFINEASDISYWVKN